MSAALYPSYSPFLYTFLHRCEKIFKANFLLLSALFIFGGIHFCRTTPFVHHRSRRTQLRNTLTTGLAAFALCFCLVCAAVATEGNGWRFGGLQAFTGGTHLRGSLADGRRRWGWRPRYGRSGCRRFRCNHAAALPADNRCRRRFGRLQSVTCRTGL